MAKTFLTVLLTITTLIIIGLGCIIYTITNGEMNLDQTVSYGTWKQAVVSDQTVVLTRTKDVKTTGFEINNVKVSW